MTEKADIVITPATWPEQVSRLTKTSTGLLNLVGWYGSTHTSAMWRKAAEFLTPFWERQVSGFDPQIKGWESSYAEIEAEVLATAAVIIIRLENNELRNGSLGSIAETGLALTSAALRGQIIIISIEDNLLTSLDEAGAIAQYMILELFLEHIQKGHELTHFFRVHRGDDLRTLATLACEVAQQQMTSGLAPVNFAEFLQKRAKRQHNYPLRVLLDGSSGWYDEVYRERFEHKKKILLTPYATLEHYALTDLSTGATGQAWQIPYGTTDHFSAALAMRVLLFIELEYKQNADLLLLAIMAESASKGAATSIGFSLLDALVTGQAIKIYLEPFDLVDYIYRQFDEITLVPSPDERHMREALQKIGVSDTILATAIQEEVAETYQTLQTLAQAERPSLKQIKKSLLGQTEAFNNADNIRRVRVLVEAHLDRLYSDPRFPDFFAYAKQIA